MIRTIVSSTSCGVAAAAGASNIVSSIVGLSVAEVKQRLEEQETLLKLLPVGVWTSGPDCRDIRGNPAAYAIFGLSPGINGSVTAAKPELPAGIRIRVNGKEVSPQDLPLQTVARTGRPWHDFEHDIVFPDGTIKSVLGSVVPLFDEHGRVRKVIAAYAGFSNRRQAEDSLRDNEARMVAIMDQMPFGIGLIDTSGRIVHANAAMRRWFPTMIPSRDPERIGRWQSFRAAQPNGAA